MRVGIAATVVYLAQCVLAQRSLPDMNVPRWSPEQRRELQVARSEMDAIEREAEARAARGEDVTYLTRLRNQVFDEHVRRYWEAEGGDDAEQLRKELLFPRFDYLNAVLDTEVLAPQAARIMVNELYADLGAPMLNFEYLSGGVLPYLEYWSWRDLAPETRGVLRDGLAEYAKVVLARGDHPIPRPAEQADLGMALYRLSDVRDTQAADLAQQLCYEAMQYARLLQWSDHEDRILTQIATSFDVENALQAYAIPPSMEDLKRVRRDFAQAIRHPVDAEKAELLLGYLQWEWGNRDTNMEVVRSYLNYATVMIRVAQNPPRGVNAETLKRCVALLNRGLIRILNTDLTLQMWNSWRGVVIRMIRLASDELKAEVYGRLAALRQLSQSASLSEQDATVLRYLEAVYRVLGPAGTNHSARDAPPK